MFRITITDLRSMQTETLSADAAKVLAIREMLSPTKTVAAPSKTPGKKISLVIAPEEFLKVVRRDYTGKEVTEDGKYIEYMNGQRLEKYLPHDRFTPDTAGVYENEDGTYSMKIQLDPSRHGGRRIRVVKLSEPQT